MTLPSGRVTGLVLALSVLGLVAPTAQDASVQAARETADPIERFLSRQDEPLTSYRAVRTLRAKNKRFNKEGWLTVLTELDPLTGFRYEIISEGGSDYIRRKVLRKMLEGEREAIAAGQQARMALSSTNYRFSVDAADGPLMRVKIVPLRKDTLLVDGTLTLDADTADLVSLEGRLAKNPSFWTSRVDVLRTYGRVAGVRVPIAVESTANLKIMGTSVFSMTYAYEAINGRVIAQPVASR
jgi:hypothetical protein